MERQQIIHNLFTGKNFNDCLNKMEPEHLREDLRQEVILIICELAPGRLEGLHDRGELEFFTVKVILNQIKSSTSPFAKKYRSHTVTIEDCTPKRIEQHATCIIDIEERLLREAIEDMAVEEVDRLYWYNKGLVELYIKHGNFRAIQKETGIPWPSAYKTIKQSLNEVKLKYK